MGLGQACKLFVGGLSAQTTTEGLRSHFAKYGRLVDAVVMTKNGRPRGFGFVTYDSPTGATAALSEAQWLDGRFVDVKRAVPGEQTMERPSNKIFVGGLPQDASTEDLRSCFARYGPVADAVVMVDRRTRRSRGFGFVRFANGAQGAAAAEAVLFNAASHRLGGKWIEVKRATPAGLLQDLSPCGSEARLYFECLAAAGWEGFAGLSPHADGAFGPRAHARGRRGRRARRNFGGEEVGWGEEEEAMAEASLYWGQHCAADAGGMEWGSGSCDLADMISQMHSFGSDLMGFELSALSTTAETSELDDEDGSLHDCGSAMLDGCAVSCGALSAESEGGLANRPVTPPPGLAAGGSSPMKVRHRGSADLDGLMSEHCMVEGFTREDFLSMEVRPWLSAW